MQVFWFLFSLLIQKWGDPSTGTDNSLITGHWERNEWPAERRGARTAHQVSRKMCAQRVAYSDSEHNVGGEKMDVDYPIARENHHFWWMHCGNTPWTESPLVTREKVFESFCLVESSRGDELQAALSCLCCLSQNSGAVSRIVIDIPLVQGIVH